MQAIRKQVGPRQRARIGETTLRAELSRINSIEEANRKFTLSPGYRFLLRADGTVYAGLAQPQRADHQARVAAGAARIAERRAQRKAEQKAAREALKAEKTQMVQFEIHLAEKAYRDNGTMRPGTRAKLINIPSRPYLIRGLERRTEYFKILDDLVLQTNRFTFKKLFELNKLNFLSEWRANLQDLHPYRKVNGIEAFLQVIGIFTQSDDCLAMIENVRDIDLVLAPEVRHRLLGHDRSAMLCSRYTYPQLGDGESVEDVLRAQYWSEFVEQNSIPMSCVMDLAIDTWRESLEKSGLGKRWNKSGHDMTYDGLIPGRDGGPMYLSDLVENVCRPLCLGICAIDIFGRVQYSYHPEMDGKTLSRNIYPGIIRFLVHEDHVWALRDHATVNQLFRWDSESREFISHVKADLQVSNRFALTNKKEAPQTKLLRSLEDLVPILKAAMDSDVPKMKLYWCEADLKPLLYEIVERMKLLPQVSMSSSSLTRITLRFGDVDAPIRETRGQDSAEVRMVTIESYNPLGMSERSIHLETDAELSAYLEAYGRMSDIIIDRNHMSWYGEGVMKAYKAYAQKAPYEFSAYGKAVGLDKRRFYASLLESIDKWPVVNQFDLFFPYQNEPIDPYSFYIVQCSIYAQERYRRVYASDECIVLGSTLLEFPHPDVTILAVQRPSQLVSLRGAISEEITSLNAGPLSDQIKKHIPNCLTGMIEKTTNKRQMCYLYRSEKYAIDASLRLPDSDGLVKTLGEGLFGVVLEKKRELINGFYPMKMVIYEHARASMQRLEDSLDLAGVQVMGCKTDCIYAKPGPALDAWVKKNKDQFGPARGQLKREPLTEIPQAWVSRKRRRPELSDQLHGVVQPLPRTLIPIRNEWDQEEFNRIFDAEMDPLLITATLPGSGKSLCIQEWVKARGRKALFVCSDNAMISEIRRIGLEAETCNRFFGFGVEQDQIATCDSSKYDTIVFEEVFKCNTSVLARIQSYIADHPEQRFLANGDPSQNGPIQRITHITDHIEYYKRCLDLIFKRGIHLNEMKSLTDPRDRKTAKKIYEALFEKKTPVYEVIRTFFPKNKMAWQDMKPEMMSVTYYNQTADLVNAEMALLAKGKHIGWAEGDLAVCRGHIQLKVRPVVNEVYRVVTLHEKHVSISSMVSGKSLVIPRGAFIEMFKRTHASTCHALQGRRVDGVLVIHDVKSPLVDARWFWTAITRCREFSKLFFCWDNRSLYDLDVHIKAKVISYKAQDEERFGPAAASSPGYVDPVWIRKQLLASKLMCFHCGIHLAESWLLDRVDPLRPHVRSNVVVACRHCNSAKAGSDKQLKNLAIKHDA